MPGGCRADGSLEDDSFAKPLPTIGLYITAASSLCAALMAVDTFLGFRSRRLWFPSKFFTLNAATLTLLAVATKLPVDLNNPMPRSIDQLSKLTSTTLMCTVMGNLIPSLGVITNLTSNIVALGILVVTISANVGVQMGTGVIYVYLPEHALILLFMLVLLIFVISSALPISTTKRQLDKLYIHKNIVLRDDMRRRLAAAGGSYDAQILRDEVETYWLMAHTSSPQYVLGRSATCTASGAFCLLSAVVLAEASVRTIVNGHPRFCNGSSDYGWSINFVWVSQAIAIIVGTIAPAVRWFTAVSYRQPENGNWMADFVVEKYWIEKLTEWKEAPLPVQIRNRRCRKIVHFFKDLALGSLAIWTQMGVVLVSKVVLLLSILPVIWVNQSRKMFKKSTNKSNTSAQQGSKLRKFVLHLEGEGALVKLISEHEKGYVEKRIKDGKKKAPTSLAKLIEPRIQARFRWAGGIDNGDRVPNLAPKGTDIPTHCWALPIVTLASIAAELPNVDKSSLKLLLRGVGEGLKYVKVIERRLEAKGLLNQRKEADFIWYHLSLDNYSWFDAGCQPGNLTPIKMIEELTKIGKNKVENFLNDGGNTDKTNTLEWPPKVLAANCLYRLASTIEQLCEEHPDLNDEHLFCWLWEAIGDLLGACLTNLPKAIYLECFCNATEVREERVRVAASLLGEAEDIMSMLSADALVSSYPSGPAKEYVDGWREREIDGLNTPGWRCSIHRLAV